ncbi:MAG: CRISPR-associated protein Cmr2 [Thermosipho sp. (in: thermotogales)]|nr:CRISPR-associated protein Cmr2 [Thermosipho sp. (in: thermotogales)]MDN5324451.1 CRISPR-associated protein Cmr2 [Thermosipho sp. (in: thermotogales)]
MSEIHKYEIFAINIKRNDDKKIYKLKYQDLRNWRKEFENFKNNQKDSKEISFFNASNDIMKNLKRITGILEESCLDNYIDNLIPYSFILWMEIELVNLYFSKDDEEYYLIHNPCLKDKAFKIPMVRGSAWKGALANAFKILINEPLEKKQDYKIREYIQSYARIFGMGSSEFKNFTEALSELLKDKLEKSSIENMIKYLIFELGLRLKKEDIDNFIKDKEKLKNWIKKKIWGEFGKVSKEDIPFFLKTHKGRAVFYPTFFDKLSLEVIHPHDRKKRKGKNPIFFEVVPRGSKGIVQVIYIPFDGIELKKEELEKQVEKDKEFIMLAFKKVSDIGIGAKSKLGWGRFEIKKEKLIINGVK